jgi:UDP-N-acetylglucosamine 2-epimerase (non-hydrolysing)
MKLLICVGTRPEFIKVKSLVENLDNVKTLFTGQHQHLVQDINFDYNIKINNKNNNRLNDIICSILEANYIFDDITHILVQGDTTSVMALALTAYNNGKKVIHLEAGLRTYNIYDPYPEELNRQIVSRIADINLCPTEYNKENLLKENIPGQIYVTGNTGLDNIDRSNCEYGNKVLITMHRRDNHHIMYEWFKTISKIAKKYSDLEFILPLHPNPNVKKHKHLLEGVKVIDPIPHNDLIKILKCSRFIITDSGGLQEEGSFLNKKVIVCRRTTERPESVGIHSIMCPYPDELEQIVDDIYNNYEIDARCPYGDGFAWKKIKEIIEENI